MCATGLLWQNSVMADVPEGINLRHTVVVDVVQKTKDAVVKIAADRVVHLLNMDPLYQDFGRVRDIPTTTLGSGFIVQRDGYVVTNNHVIDRAMEIWVELSDGRRLKAEIIGADPRADLAVLRVHSSQPLPTIEMGESSDLMIGEPVVAVGNPFGYSHSVSTGIVSALHRDLRDDENHESLTNLIQTDAAINPGNSGGPLLNAYGQVIGINTAIRSNAQNIGFAIPIDNLRDLIPTLMNPATAEKVEVPLRLTERRTITPPATIDAQVMDGDTVVRKIGGQPVHNIVDAYALLLQAKVGEKFDVVTNQGTRTIAAGPTTSVSDPAAVARRRLGIGVQSLTPQLADQMGLATSNGVLVSRVLRDSPAANADVAAGDIVFQLGSVHVHSMESLGIALQHLPANGPVQIGVIRGNRIGYGFIKL